MPSLNESDGGKVKPAGYKQEYTKENIIEILKCRKDPIYFIKKYVYIEHPTKGRMLFDLFDFQESLIKTYNSHNRVIAMLSRQCGKTITAAAYLLWWAIFKDNQQILIASKDADGSKEIMDRLWFAYEELPWWIKPGTKTNQVHTKVFDNNSKIRATATTKTSGRGKSNSLVYLDEFSFVRPGIANDFWTAIYPTLSTGGKCIITSTPNTDEDKFAQIWFNAEMSHLSDEWHDPYADRSKTPTTADEENYETIFESEDAKQMFEFQDGFISSKEEDEADNNTDDFVAFHAHWTKVPESNGGYRGEKFKRQAIAAGLTHEEWMREFECVQHQTFLKIKDLEGTEFSIQIGDLYNFLNNMKELVINDKGLTVWTPSGWQEFAGVAKMGEKEIVRLEFDNGGFLECSENHGLFNAFSGEKTPVSELKVGSVVMGDEEDLEIINIEYTGRVEMTYDLIEVNGGHQYLTNGTVSSNCAFVSGDSTLISGSKLATLRRDIRKPKFVDRWGGRWYEEIRPNVAYGVVLDPSEGVGLDDACIQVWEIPSLRQVAEWNSNFADQTEQTKMLRRVLKRLFHMQQDHPDHMGDCNIYYSVERNGLGVGILQTIEYEDELTFPGFLIDSTMTSSNIRGAGFGQEKQNKWRGLITTVPTKKRYAVEFKNLVEQNLFTVRSKFLASQMKTFVRKGQSYAAKEGSKDDIVMSCVLMCHLIDEVRYHEPDLDDLIRPDLDDYDPEDMEHPDNMAMPPML